MKILCLSDTHGKHGFLDIPLEGIDMLIFAGDESNSKNPHLNANESLDFIEWIESLHHIPYRVWIAGNHSTAIEKGLVKPKELCKESIYLNHEMKIVNGLKIFGSAMTPTFGTDWAYNRKREKLHDYWQHIPEDLDILITHGPPQGILDLSKDNVLTGCKSLMKRITEVQPKYHVFGHIHEWSGWSMQHASAPTKFINAAVVNLGWDYKLNNNGQIIEI